MRDVLEFDVYLDRSVDEAWSLVTDPAALGTWMLGSFEFDAVSGSDLVFRSDDVVKRGEVIDVETERRFAWRWTDGSETSEVVITLDGASDGCDVKITERLLPPRRWAKPSIPPVEASIA